MVVCPPGFHAYVVPPDAVKVVLLPLQIVKEGAGVMMGVGIALTVTTDVAELVHPLPLSAITV
jgi:hypothetical protein